MAKQILFTIYRKTAGQQLTNTCTFSNNFGHNFLWLSRNMIQSFTKCCFLFRKPQHKSLSQISHSQQNSLLFSHSLLSCMDLFIQITTCFLSLSKTRFHSIKNLRCNRTHTEKEIVVLIFSAAFVSSHLLSLSFRH